MALISSVSIWMIPLIIGIVLLYGTWKRVPTYETFVDGGKEGFQMAVSIIPYLVGMLVSIGVFRASGAMDALIDLIKPFLSAVGIPAEIIPQALIRPLSGNGALGMMTDLFKTKGPDSYIGRLASTLQGATDTTLYIVTVYFGAIGIRKIGDSLKVGFLADFVGIIGAIVVVKLVFG
ncbi:spore maturation protein B [Pullulanibacillus pueri]|uniref:Spore maturation protein B n=1 Tax=Pullulanibacillus pueri TaxID=1437324 RepID=A0A8J3ELI4_9BACL|nr:spore maturation protein [Pullulanibacillus pueri]MBM7681508.1 spore maturation protein B [Pullulanibacillus pueri]GGH79160.1 spore maturation protein B [Pullulanibacillus pueri]